jgi:hypothetical protein
MMPFNYTVYTLKVSGNPKRGYDIASDCKTDHTLKTSKSAPGDIDILDLIWSFLGSDALQQLTLPGNLTINSALRKHLGVERDPDFPEFLYIKDQRSQIPLLKLEEQEITLTQPLEELAKLDLPLKLGTIPLTPKNKPETPTIVSDEDVARNRRLLDLVAALLQKTTHWQDKTQLEQQQTAAILLKSALKNEGFEAALADIKAWEN